MTISSPPMSARLPERDDDAQERSARSMGAVVDRLHSLRQSNLWRVEVPGPQTPGMVSTTTVFAGVFLTLTPLLWAGSANSSGWTAAGWNAAITGIAITALGLVRLSQPLRLGAATGLGCLLGGWLVLAPLFLDYDVAAQSILVANVDILVGIAVLLVTILGHRHARSRPEISEHSQQDGR